MSEVDAGVALTPEENAFFESGGVKAPEATPPVEPTKEPEPEPVKAKEPEGDKVEKVVPLGALHEERGKRKAVEQRLREMELENTRYAERFRIVDEFAKTQKEPQPDPGADPIAYLQRMPGELDGLRQEVSAFKQQQQQQTQIQQLAAWAKQSEQKFVADKPDYFDAVSFLKQGRAKELENFGLNPAEINKAIEQEELQIVASAAQRGTSPAEIAYNIAVSRGFKAKPADAAQPDAAAKLASIEKGQAANKSLSSAGGQSGADEITADALLKMPMDEFEAWVNKNPAKAKRIMGG